MRCASCGTKLSRTMVYCPSCGTMVSPKMTEPASVVAPYESPPDEQPIDEQPIDEQPIDEQPANPYEQNASGWPNQNERPLPPHEVMVGQNLNASLSTQTFNFVFQFIIDRLLGLPIIRGIRIQINPARMIGIIFAGFGLIFGIPGLIMFINTQNFLHGTIASQGQIVSCQMQAITDEQNHSVSYVCQPTVRFTTTSGQEIEFVPSVSSDSYHEGDQVPVQYHPNNPQDAEISSFVGLWLLPLIFGGLGVLFLLIGLIVTLRSQRPHV